MFDDSPGAECKPSANRCSPISPAWITHISLIPSQFLVAPPLLLPYVYASEDTAQHRSATDCSISPLCDNFLNIHSCSRKSLLLWKVCTTCPCLFETILSVSCLLVCLLTKRSKLIASLMADCSFFLFLLLQFEWKIGGVQIWPNTY